MEFVVTLLTFVVAIIFLFLAALFVLSHITPWPNRTRDEFLKPCFVYTPDGVEYERFPTILHQDRYEIPPHTPPSIYISVIVPAMNERERVPLMLEECFHYLEERAKESASFTYEVIIVDDGSSDNTADVAFQFVRKFGSNKMKILKLQKNRGKGGAIRCGMLHSRGAMLLFADADGATKFSDLEKLENGLLRLTTADSSIPNDRYSFDWTFPALAVGSRAHLESESIVERSVFRTILMLGFHMLVYVFTVKTIRDTQCGFKLFTRSAAAKLFPILHIERYAFDVEILYLAEKYGLPMAEIPVTWHEVDGSKVVPIWSWLEMGRDLFLIWFRYLFGIWKTELRI